MNASCSNLAKLIQAGGKTLCSDIHRLNSIWNEGELPQQWKEFTLEPVYEKDGKIDHNNYWGMSLM